MANLLEKIIAALFISCSPAAPEEEFKPIPTQNEPPVVQFDPAMSRNIRLGTKKEFVAMANDPDGNSNDPYGISCRWDFGDGSAETLATTCEKLFHTYTKPGMYTVKVTAMDPHGAKGSVEEIFTAYLNIPPRVDAGKDVTMSPGYYYFAFGTITDKDECYGEPGEFFAPHHNQNEHPETTDEDGFIPDDEYRDGFIFDSSYRAYPYCDKNGNNCGGYVFGKCPYIDYTEPGEYRLNLEVSDNEGGTGTDSIDVRVTND